MNTDEYQQFQHISDILSNRNEKKNKKLDSDFLLRDLASKDILESIGVDLKKFLNVSDSK